MSRLRRACAAQEGFTLIEILVAMVVTGFVLVAAFYLVSGIFNSDTRSTQDLSTRDALAKATEYLSLNLGPATTGALGVPCGYEQHASCPSDGSSSAPERLVPTSISGDQLVFTSNGTCYRIYYGTPPDPASDGAEYDLLVASAPTGEGCSSVAPPGGLAGPSKGTSDPDYSSDPVLDPSAPGHVFSQSLLNSTGAPLTMGVVNREVLISQNSLLTSLFTQASCPMGVDRVPVFTYLDAEGGILCPDGTHGPYLSAEDPEGEGEGAWYQGTSYGDRDGSDRIAAVLVTIYAQTKDDVTAPRLMSQEVIDLGQPVSTEPANTTLPSVTPSEHLALGSTLTGSLGGWDLGTLSSNTTFAWQWCTSGPGSGSQGICPTGYAAIPTSTTDPKTSGSYTGNLGGAPHIGYTIQDSDSGDTMTLAVTATNVSGSVEATSSRVES